MRKFAIVVASLFAFLGIAMGTLHTIDKTYSEKIDKVYYDGIGDVLSEKKNGGLILQEKGIEQGENLLIFGSSELSGGQNPFHPTNFFKDKADGFQIDLIGRGYSQSLIHAINFAALGDKLKNQKIAIIISPQWFSVKGLQSKEFAMNFSELQFYKVMFDSNANKDIKLGLAKRVNMLSGGSDATSNMKPYAYLYEKDNAAAKILMTTIEPYYRIKYYLLSIKDKIETERILKAHAGDIAKKPVRTTAFKWKEEQEKAIEIGKKEANNNDFAIGNEYYNTYIKDKLVQDKGMYKNDSFKISPEYDDLKLLLEICKRNELKPLFISVPVHGKWYDYCQFDKADRNACYESVNKMVTSYGFDIADLSKYEYEEYFLRDIMHLGWKGWVYTNEALDRYYHKN